MKVLIVSAASLMFAISVIAQEKHEPAPVKVNQSQVQSVAATVGTQTTSQATAQTMDIRNPRNAPLAIAPEAYPSAPCRVGISAGASSLVGGISLGGSKMDNECDKRETARSFERLGLKEAALKILCTTKAAKKALGADCLKQKPGKTWEEENSLTFPN